MGRGFADGLIISPIYSDERITKLISALQMPVVLIGNLPDGVDVDNVHVDSSAGVAMAINHLVETGRTKIGFINGPINTKPGMRRKAAFEKAIKAAGFKFDKASVIQANTFSPEAGYFAFSEIEDFSKFIDLDATLASAYYYRGMISSNWGMRGRLETYYDFTKAIKLDPNFAEAHFERGVQMFKIESLPNRESFSMDEINANYTKAIELKPNYPEAYFHRGIAKSDMRKKDYTGAIADYTIAIELNRNFVDAYYNRGNTYYRIRRNNEACLDLKKTAELGKPYVYDLIKEYASRTLSDLKKELINRYKIEDNFH